MSQSYFRPILQTDHARAENAHSLAGGWCWFDKVEVLHRDSAPRLISAEDLPPATLKRLTKDRSPICGVAFNEPSLMGILNVTPDSFSDGGQFFDPDQALEHALSMESSGAKIIDVGGESTRPGAREIDASEEIERTSPLIEALRTKTQIPISIDTRKATVARAAQKVGANLVNDVSGFTFDPALAPFCSEQNLPVCVMHAQGTPDIMQKDPRYDNVALDVYDYLSDRVDALTAAGISRNKIIIDPGIGFGKTLEHNLTLLRNLSIFHGIGCPILLGASRKRFIGTISGTEEANQRVAGSLAVALAGVSQGVQIFRVHDVAEHAEAMKLWQASTLL